jgi:hypothetical protein
MRKTNFGSDIEYPDTAEPGGSSFEGSKIRVPGEVNMDPPGL